MVEPRKNFNAADPRQVLTQKQREKRDQLLLENGERYVMSDARGRYFIRWLLAECGMYRQSFTGNSETFFNEGKRAVGIQLTMELEAGVPEEFLLMWKEHLEERVKTEEQLEEKKDAVPE